MQEYNKTKIKVLGGNAGSSRKQGEVRSPSSVRPDEAKYVNRENKSPAKNPVQARKTNPKSIRKPDPKVKKTAKTEKNKKIKRAKPIPGGRRVQRSWKCYIIHITLATVLFMASIVALSVTMWFNADRVILKGDSIYSPEEILNCGNIETGVNLFRFDSATALTNIEESLVYIENVTIKREFPSAIVVTVEPTETVFNIEYEGKYLEISSSGRILSLSHSRPTGLIVSGFIPNEPTIGGYIDCAVTGQVQTELVFNLADLVDKHSLTEISRIDVSDKFDVKLFNGEDERVEVKLGSPIQLDGKFAMAAEIITEQIEPNERGVLRISNPRRGTFRPEME